jgi:hypothetical protein
LPGGLLESGMNWPVPLFIGTPAPANNREMQTLASKDLESFPEQVPTAIASSRCGRADITGHTLNGPVAVTGCQLNTAAWRWGPGKGSVRLGAQEQPVT